MKPPFDDTIVHLHGVAIPDPYRPLENLDAPETLAWIDDQKQRTESAIIDRDFVADFANDIQTILNYPKQYLPLRRGERNFFFANTGVQQHEVLMVQDGESEPRPLIDPNIWPEEEAQTLDFYAPSPDGRHVAYFTSRSGSDWKSLHVLEVDTGKHIDGSFPLCRLPDAPQWKADGLSFIYLRAVAPPDVIACGGNPENKLFEHRVGTDPAQDSLYYEPLASAHRFEKMHVRCGSFISLRTGDEFVYNRWGASHENAMYLRDAQGKFVEILGPGSGGRLDLTTGVDGFIYGLTTVNSPRGRMVRIDPAKPSVENWQTLVPERTDEVLNCFGVVEDQLLTVWRRDAAEHVEAFLNTGEPLSIVYAPEMSTLFLQKAHPNDNHIQIGEVSHRSPFIFHRYEALTQKLTFLDKAKILRDLTSDNIVVQKVEAESKDGTLVPMVIVYDKTKVRFDGTARTWMYGYGGFGDVNSVTFCPVRMRRIEQGGVYVDTFIRGGGERGQEWYLGGVGKNKQNSYDDFIACAEYMVKHGYTSPERLAISGASNGGLMVLACAIQRPDLFGAVFSDVPVADLVRYPTATTGANWAHEYGDPDKADEFSHLIKISPLHNIQKGQRYPAMLVTAGRYDTRVVPWHAYKFVAAMRELSPETVCYLNVMENAGHMGAVGLSNRLQVAGIKECFARHVLGPIPPDEYKVWKAARRASARPSRSP